MQTIFINKKPYFKLTLLNGDFYVRTSKSAKSVKVKNQENLHAMLSYRSSAMTKITTAWKEETDQLTRTIEGLTAQLQKAETINKPTKVTPELEAKMIELWLNKETTKNISAQLNLSERTVRRYLNLFKNKAKKLQHEATDEELVSLKEHTGIDYAAVQ